MCPLLDCALCPLLIPIHAVMKGSRAIFAQIPLRSALALTDKAEKAETGTAKSENPQNFRVFLTSKLQRKEKNVNVICECFKVKITFTAPFY